LPDLTALDRASPRYRALPFHACLADADSENEPRLKDTISIVRTGEASSIARPDVADKRKDFLTLTRRNRARSYASARPQLIRAMSHRAKTIAGTNRPYRWMAEIIFRDGQRALSLSRSLRI
jgi:hypothetical protein